MGLVSTYLGTHQGHWSGPGGYLSIGIVRVAVLRQTTTYLIIRSVAGVLFVMSDQSGNCGNYQAAYDGKRS